jgi:outer membrane receptor protein involved in Fe transport
MRIHGWVLLFGLAGSLMAQCRLEVTVEDATGGRIGGAVVRLADPLTNRMLSAPTSEEGLARFASAPCGAVQLAAQFGGFDEARETVRLAAGVLGQLKVVLRTTGLAERIQVTEGVDLLQTARATQSVSLGATQIQTLPTASRNYTHLIVTEAGVSAPLPDRTGKGMNLATSPGGQGDDGSQSLNPSVNGARPTNNSVSINGLDTTNMMNANGSLGNNLSVPLDALEVVEVQTALFSAATGRNGGGNIQMITRSGTNAFHGSAYHFLQNEKFNANEFFLNRAGTRRPQFRRNETGVTFGGPIRKNQTFFFGSVQRTDFMSGYAAKAIARTGVPDGLNFENRTAANIADVANRWMASGARDNPQFRANFLTALRAFPADQIPGLERKFFSDVSTLQFRTLTPSDIHPVALNMLNVKRNGSLLLPSVNDTMQLLPGTASFGAERALVQVFPTFFRGWSGNGTIEHNFSPTHRMRLNYINSTQYVEEAFPWAASSVSPTQGQTPSYTASLSDVRTFGPQWVNDFRGGFFELYNTRISKYKDIFNSTLGINNPIEKAIGGLASLMPTVDIVTQLTGAGIGNAWDFYDRQRVINVADTLSFNTAKHTLQMGGELRRPTIKGEYMARTNGDLDYNNWVLFFTGHGASGGGSDLDQGDTRRHFKMRDYGFFVQDDWRVRRGLTLNLGVRWDYYGNPSDADGRIGNFYNKETAARMGLEPGFYVAENSVFFQPNFDPIKLGLVLAPGTPWDLKSVRKSPTASTLLDDRNNLAPRIGLAWQPQKYNKLVVRAGYGIFYERPSGAIKGDLQLTPPFFFFANVPSPVDMANPYPSLNVNPFQIPVNVTIARNATGSPSWRRADGSAFPATEPFGAKNMTFIDPFIRTPYVQQWTFNTQFEPMRGSLLDVRYVGTRGVKLMGRVNMTQPQDPRVKPVNGFTDIYTTTGALINPDFFVDPQYLGLSRSGGFRYRSNWGSSSYHALQANFRRRMGKFVTGNFGYTWQKSIDTVSSDNAVIEHDATRIANNRGPSSFDRTHRFTAAYVVEIPNPFGSKKGFRSASMAGWTVSGMTTMQSGSPFSVFGASTRNAMFSQPSAARLDFAPGKNINDARLSGRVQDRLDAFYNVGAFTDSLDRWGNTGRSILRGPAQVQHDFVISKWTRLKEQLGVELRFELYNAFNQTTFSNPASTFAAAGPGTAGRITSTIGGPRTMQTGMRVRW